jgi:hypothetical protein
LLPHPESRPMNRTVVKIRKPAHERLREPNTRCRVLARRKHSEHTIPTPKMATKFTPNPALVEDGLSSLRWRRRWDASFRKPVNLRVDSLLKRPQEGSRLICRLYSDTS